MRPKLINLLFCIFLLASCEYKPVNPALWTAGDYTRRYRKVFETYSKPEDSLKLKAARFLIQNMDNHFYYQPENEAELDSFFRNSEARIALPYLNDTGLYQALRSVLINNIITESLSNGSLHKPEYKKRSDIKTITPDFIVENIEYAFKVWNFPWARAYSFDDFCRYILPYRYGTEVPELWRKTIYEQLKWVVDSVGNPSDPVEVASLINKQFTYRLSFAEQLKKNGIKLKISNQFDARLYGSCEFQSGIGVCVLRSLGIATTPVVIPNWGNLNYGHELTGMLDAENNWRYFNFGESGPEVDLKFRPPKMFIKRFDKMKHFSPVQEDVSAELMEVADLEIDINAAVDADIYLCVFGNLKWSPFFKGENRGGKVVFKSIGLKNNMFLAATKSKGKLMPVSKAFSMDTLGNVTYYQPNHSKLTEATLVRKWAYWGYIDRITDLIGGEFSVSDSWDFSNKQTLYKISDTLNYYNNVLKCVEQKGRFFRYDFPQLNDTVFDGPAEISFYTSQNDSLIRIEGNYSGAPQLSEEHIKLMTDNDILTYMEVWDCREDLPANLNTGHMLVRKDNQPLWIAMETDTAVTVTHVGICPRNDKNGIYAGMHYELFYWDNAWKSLGIQVAEGDNISYEGIPENAVLWLRNLDEGKEERIFTLDKGKQVWW